MTTILLSQHSSNPLEVGSSDPRNRNYHRQYSKLQRMRGGPASSDDPVNGYNMPDVGEYQSHIAGMFPTIPISIKSTRTSTQKYVDLDEDMESDDELDVVMAEDEEEEEEDRIDEDEDASGETDEEMTIHLKSPEERDEIEEEIADLEEAVPQLSEDYRLVDRLGTGTFSSVYKAIDLGYHDKWDNTPWHGNHPPSSSAYYQSVPRTEPKVFVAIKRIYVTSNPERIRNEISIMEDCRGCRHVSQLVTAFRQDDQVVAIMPYHRNEDFREFYNKLPMAGIKAYFRCMFRALRDIHARGVIHRDVKPANFLFDPRTGIGTLCDFGLASRMDSSYGHGSCLHTSPTREYPHGRIRSRAEINVEQVKRMQREARVKSSWPSERVGYPDKDTRPHSKANRAGTRGFRAPEVLLKCAEQTGAIDVWSAGMILLFFLTHKFPLLQSSDDMEALMELATILGRKRMEKTAAIHSRTFATNVPSVTQDGITWRAFVEKQNPSIYTPPEPDPRYMFYTSHSHTQTHMDTHLPPPSSSSSPPPGSPRQEPSSSGMPPSPQPSETNSYVADLENAFDFLDQVMRPESTQRITPRAALYHPFLAIPDELEDDEFFPHPFGEGVCGELHFTDDVTEEPCVKVNFPDGTSEVRRLLAGEGTAIGSQPCEFHRDEFGC